MISFLPCSKTKLAIRFVSISGGRIMSFCFFIGLYDTLLVSAPASFPDSKKGRERKQGAANLFVPSPPRGV